MAEDTNPNLPHFDSSSSPTASPELDWLSLPSDPNTDVDMFGTGGGSGEQPQTAASNPLDPYLRFPAPVTTPAVLPSHPYQSASHVPSPVVSFPSASPSPAARFPAPTTPATASNVPSPAISFPSAFPSPAARFPLPTTPATASTSAAGPSFMDFGPELQQIWDEQNHMVDIAVANLEKRLKADVEVIYRRIKDLLKKVQDDANKKIKEVMEMMGH